MEKPAMVTVYLDLKDWIRLAKARHRQDAPDSDRETARILEEAVASDRARFPVGNLHFIEIAKIGSKEQRVQLATLMADLSAGSFLAASPSIVEHEIDDALRQLFQIDTGASFSAFARNMFGALDETSQLASTFGTSTESLDLMAAVVGPRKMLLEYLEFPDEEVRRSGIEQLSRSTELLTKEIQARRSSLAGKSRKTQDEIYRNLLFGQSQDKVWASLRRIGRNEADLAALPRDLIVSIMHRVPCWDVECALASQIERQQSQPTKPNDFADILSLRTAIPYCNVVVTEKLWTDLARRAGLPTKYNTQVISSIHEIAQFLPLG